MALAKTWQMLPGSRILDIGCGQGESSLVLAELLGPGGHVTGIDTAPHDYGSPFTVGDAQSYIKKSIYGERIDFLQTDAARLLSIGEQDAGQSHQYNLSMELSYLIVCADYSYEASLPEQVPHVLASRAQALVHASKKPRPTRKDEPNVRAAPHPAKVIEIASAAGFILVKEDRITPGPHLRDGHWESTYVQMGVFRDSIVQEGLDAESVAEVLALVEQVEQAYSQMMAQGCNIARTMDVWCATFELV
ncbi:hypothetical protein KC318_g194 [Hortaea werneckii]|nr:hypothetical protein KC334_g720 [Hortaea werneckii]KAI7027492.1 hypothetical protein KC355_g305 [Hortaea werneckii]KAI7676558.1 hypothetical protein KC318_g194 [Hortaea werneckii]